MAKSASNNIKIHFRAEGEKELKNAIQTLAMATNQLKNSQKQLAASIGMTDTQRKKAIATGQLALRNQRNMNAANAQGAMSFSVLRSKLLLASFAMGLIAASVGKLVKAFAEQESSEARIDAALASTGNISRLTGEQIRGMTARLEEVGVVGDEVNNKVASLLLTFTNIRGEAFERTMIAANNMAISISGGIPTFEQLKSTALQLGKALQDPAGQLGALSRSGFTFTGTQKEMIKMLVEQNRLFEAQTIILDAADTQYGELSEKMRTVTEGAFAALGNASGSLAETIGKILTPATVAFTESLTKTFKSLAKNEASIRAAVDTMKLAAKSFLLYKGVLFATAVTTKQLTAATLVLRSVLHPFTAVLAFLGVGYFQVKKRQAEFEIGTREVTKSIVAQSEAVGANLEDWDKVKEKLDARVDTTRKSAEVAKIDAKITRESTLERKLQVLQEKKAILVKQELSKISVENQELAREAVTEIVQGIIAKEEDVIVNKHVAESLKKIHKAQAERAVMIQGTTENMRLFGVTQAKVAAFSKVSTKEQFDGESKRIEQLEKADAVMRAMGIENNFLAEAIKSGQTVAQLSFVNTDKEIQKALASVGLLVNEEGKLVEITEKFGKSSEDAFKKFQEQASMAVTALMGFGVAQTQLVEERMNRELEALKATKDFEEATQEEREVMENRVEQRFKKQRRRAFLITKASNIADATMNVAQAYTKALATMPPPGNIPLAAFIAALGAAQVATIAAQPAPRFATGGSFITSGAQNLVVGEQGAERVTIQPLGGRNARQSGSSNQIININVSAPLIDDTILDVIIPKIEEAGKLNLA
jgi:hypothetical protein